MGSALGINICERGGRRFIKAALGTRPEREGGCGQSAEAGLLTEMQCNPQFSCEFKGICKLLSGARKLRCTPELFQVGVRGARPLYFHVDQYLGMGCSGIGRELR